MILKRYKIWILYETEMQNYHNYNKSMLGGGNMMSILAGEMNGFIHTRKHLKQCLL